MADKLGWKQDNNLLELPRLIGLEQFFEVDKRGRTNFAAGIDIFNVIVDLYEKQYQYQLRHKQPFAQFETGDTPFFEVTWGSFPEDESLIYISRAYVDAFEPQRLPYSPESYSKFLQEGFLGPLWVTTHTLEESVGRGSHDPIIFIFDPTDPQDVIDYWNYRLFQSKILPVNIAWLEHHTEFLREKITNNHRPIPYNPFGTMFHTEVEFGRSVSRELARELISRHFSGLPDRSFFVGGYPSIWKVSRQSWPPEKILVTGKSASFDEQADTEKYIKIPAPSPEFTDSGGLHTTAYWVNVIIPNELQWQEDVASVFPSQLWSPDRFHLGARLTVTREGWKLSQRSTIGYELLQPISGRQAIIEWLAKRGIQATPSEAGQIAHQIIEAAGSLLGCSMFADKATLELLNGMAESQSEHVQSGNLRRRIEPDRAKHRNTIFEHFRSRAKRSFGYWNALDYFLKRSVFRAGLRVQCPACAYYNWFDLDAISYRPTCSRCLKAFEFSQAPESLGKTEWFYRVIGPFAAPSYVRGGYAVALSLRCLQGMHEIEMTWSTGLDLSPLTCEVDFVAWYRRSGFLSASERDEPDLIIGEAKSFGLNAIDERSLKNLRLVAQQFPTAYIIVSTLKDISDYSQNEIQLLTELARWGRRDWVDDQPRYPLIILTGTELFSDHGIHQAWKDAGGKAAALVEPAYVNLTDLSQLAEYSQLLYLNLPPFHEDLVALYNARRKIIRALQLRITLPPNDHSHV